jgi:hypothetical protein
MGGANIVNRALIRQVLEVRTGLFGTDLSAWDDQRLSSPHVSTQEARSSQLSPSFWWFLACLALQPSRWRLLCSSKTVGYVWTAQHYIPEYVHRCYYENVKFSMVISCLRKVCEWGSGSQEAVKHRMYKNVQSTNCEINIVTRGIIEELRLSLCILTVWVAAFPILWATVIVLVVTSPLTLLVFIELIVPSWKTKPNLTSWSESLVSGVNFLCSSKCYLVCSFVYHIRLERSTNSGSGLLLWTYWRYQWQKLLNYVTVKSVQLLFCKAVVSIISLQFSQDSLYKFTLEHHVWMSIMWFH